MGKKKQKQKSQIKVENVKSDTLMVIDDERITKIIVNALAEYDKQKQEAAKVEKEKEVETAEAKLGIKGNKGKFLAALKILIHPKKYAKDVNAGAELVKLALYFFYKSIEWIVAVCAVLLLVTIPLQYVFSNITHLKWYINVICGVWGMDLLLISRIFRIAAIEVDEIRDNNYLFGLFAAMASIISIIVAIVALLK